MFIFIKIIKDNFFRYLPSQYYFLNYKFFSNSRETRRWKPGSAPDCGNGITDRVEGKIRTTRNISRTIRNRSGVLELVTGVPDMVVKLHSLDLRIPFLRSSFIRGPLGRRTPRSETTKTRRHSSAGDDPEPHEPRRNRISMFDPVAQWTPTGRRPVRTGTGG